VIIENQRDITDAVLAEISRADNPRFREIMSAAVRHLHDFARDARLTEAEFQQACALVAQLGQRTTASHNEVVLCAGSLGLSALVCRVNNPAAGTANLLGPFWRSGAPALASGASLLRSPTPGEAVRVRAEVVNGADGQPVAGADVDVWHASPEGYYENQDPAQADMNLRGRFVTDAQGRFEFTTVKPRGYPVPVNGPVGDLLRLQGRHNLRPAHIHFLIAKAGFKTQFAQVYSADDPNLESDSQFAVMAPLVATYRPQGDGSWLLEQRFVLQPGPSRLPVPPIAGKAEGARPVLEVLVRRDDPPAA